LFAQCGVTLIVAVLAAGAVGYVPTQSRWGAEGVQSMMVVAGICLGAAVLGAVPMAIVARLHPDMIGQAALAGLVIRLFAAMGGCITYQLLGAPHMASFMFWAVVFYLILLAVETTFGVVAVRRHYRVMSDGQEAARS